MITKFIIGSVLLVSSAWLQAAPLTESKFTDIVHTVDVLSQPAKEATPATLDEIFKSPDLVRTGVASRAELTAPDQTITRVGANTVFSFAPSGREINLEQGSVLFHSPTGRGGGMIKSGGASAAVSGTTLIVATTPVTNPADRNGFKVILLEGKGRVTLPNGHHRKLKAGQMVFVLPGHDHFGPVLTINLAKLVAGSALVGGFSHELPSLGLIQLAIQQQQHLLQNGKASDTGTPADNFLNNPPPDNGPFAGPRTGDPNILQAGFNYPVYKNLGQDQGRPPTSPTPIGVVSVMLNPPPPPYQILPPPVPSPGGIVIVGISHSSPPSQGAFPPLPPPPLLPAPVQSSGAAGLTLSGLTVITILPVANPITLTPLSTTIPPLNLQTSTLVLTGGVGITKISGNR